MARIPPFRIVVAEDDPLQRALLIHPLRACGMEVEEAVGGEEALEAVARSAPDVLLLDLRMPGMDGLEVLRRLQSVSDPPDVLVVTGDASAESAVAAMRLGARDYLTKPWDPQALLARVRNAGERRRLAVDVRRHRARAALESSAPEFLTRDPLLRRRLAAALGAAPSGVPILISGESGTGKDLLARRIHQLSGVRDGPFVAVNTSTDPWDLEEELFGVENRARDGSEGRMGLVELADGGTLLLDGVDVLPEAIQRRLLRLVTEGMVRRVGGGPARRVSPRIIGTSERPLAEAVAGGRVAADLLHGMGTVSVELSPLRARKGDVTLLARHFLRTLPAGGEGRTLSPGARRKLRGWSWPGNVRELRNVLERALLLASNPEVDEEDLLLENMRRPASNPAGQETPLQSLAQMERDHIARVLDATEWHRARAAELLGIGPKTLYRKVREYGLTPP